jgi:hypothetical protein
MAEKQSDDTAKRRFGCLHVFLFILAAVVVTVIVCFFAFRAYLFPQPFRPVTLTAREEAALQTKLERLNVQVAPVSPLADKRAALEPEAYSETAAARKIQFSEKELNALLAKNTELADKVAIDLSPGLVSARILVPIDPDVPVIGGKTLRLKTGLSYSFTDGKPVLILKGVTVMSVPLPSRLAKLYAIGRPRPMGCTPRCGPSVLVIGIARAGRLHFNQQTGEIRPIATPARRLTGQFHVDHGSPNTLCRTFATM